MKSFLDRFKKKPVHDYEPPPVLPSMARAPRKRKTKDPTKLPGGQAGVTYEVYNPELHNK